MVIDNLLWRPFPFGRRVCKKCPSSRDSLFNLLTTRGLNFLRGLGLELCGATLVLILEDHEVDIRPFHVSTVSRERIFKHGEIGRAHV